MSPIQVAPSLLASDFGRFREELVAVTEAGADSIHFDVMDGTFVPNISFGAGVVKALREDTELPFDVHLMIADPDRYLDLFIEAGANIVTVHAEACIHLHRTLSRIRELGAKAGVALNPATPLSTVTQILDNVDLLLIMTVNPGFGGQKFIPAMTTKIQAAREIISRTNHTPMLEVDGGITVANVAEVHAAGANVMVSGSGIFKTPDYAKTIQAMREAAGKLRDGAPTMRLKPIKD